MEAILQPEGWPNQERFGHVELQRLERAPGPAQLQEWKDALNWLFRCGRGQRKATQMGVPPLGRTDLGRPPLRAAAGGNDPGTALVVAHGADLRM